MNYSDLKTKKAIAKEAIKGKLIARNLELEKVQFDNFGNIINNPELQDLTDDDKNNYDLQLMKTCISQGKIPPLPFDFEKIGIAAVNQVLTSITPARKPVTTAKNGFVNCALKKCEGREALGGVHYFNGYRHVTDGNILIRQRFDYTEDKEGKTFNPLGFELEGNYPPCDSVIPAINSERYYYFTDMNIQNIAGSLKSLTNATKKNDVFVNIQNKYYNAISFLKLLNGLIDAGISYVVVYHNMKDGKPILLNKSYKGMDVDAVITPCRAEHQGNLSFIPFENL